MEGTVFVPTAMELVVESESRDGEGEASERSEACRLWLLDVVSIGSARNRRLGGLVEVMMC